MEYCWCQQSWLCVPLATLLPTLTLLGFGGGWRGSLMLLGALLSSSQNHPRITQHSTLSAALENVNVIPERPSTRRSWKTKLAAFMQKEISLVRALQAFTFHRKEFKIWFYKLRLNLLQFDGKLKFLLKSRWKKCPAPLFFHGFPYLKHFLKFVSCSR